MYSICRIAVLLAVAVLLPSAHAAQSVYKWVDDDGVTHYSQQPPPPGREVQLIDPNTSTDTQQASKPSSDSASGGNADGSGTSSERGGGPKNMTEFCNQVRERIATLESSDPVSVRQPDDTLKRLSDEERAQQLERARGQLQQHCSDSDA